MRFAPLSLGLVALCMAVSSQAATPAPPLTSGAAAQALYAQWFVPQSAQASGSAQQLHGQLQQYCDGTSSLEKVREQFTQASQDWERLSALAMGPQIEHRTARMVDFQPMRLPLLKAALRKAPKDLAAMETIGGPAKGFPALEHLLWVDVAAPKPPHASTRAWWPLTWRKSCRNSSKPIKPQPTSRRWILKAQRNF